MLTDVALIAALYVILKRANQNLAVFAAFMRVIETAIGVTATLACFDVVRFLSGADYQKAFGTDQLQALAMISTDAYRAWINILEWGPRFFAICGSSRATFRGRWPHWA